MDIETIHFLYHYSDWANDQVWDCILELSDAQFTQAHDYAWESVHGQIVHVMGAEYIWFSRLRGTSPDALPRPADYPSRAAVRARWQEIRQMVWDTLNSYTSDDLARDFTYTNTRGDSFTNNIGKILLHVVNHGTDHRAQILYMIHQMGGRTVEQDMVHRIR